MLFVQSARPFASNRSFVKFRKKGIISRTLDTMKLNTTNYYDTESDPNNNDIQVMASNYLAYKVGKLYVSQLSSNLLSIW